MFQKIVLIIFFIISAMTAASFLSAGNYWAGGLCALFCVVLLWAIVEEE